MRLVKKIKEDFECLECYTKQTELYSEDKDAICFLLFVLNMGRTFSICWSS